MFTNKLVPVNHRTRSLAHCLFCSPFSSTNLNKLGSNLAGTGLHVKRRYTCLFLVSIERRAARILLRCVVPTFGEKRAKSRLNLSTYYKSLDANPRGTMVKELTLRVCVQLRVLPTYAFPLFRALALCLTNTLCQIWDTRAKTEVAKFGVNEVSLVSVASNQGFGLEAGSS